MRVKFRRERNWTPPEERRITVKYRAGQEYTVKRDWGIALVAAGDAEEVDAPGRDAQADIDASATPAETKPRARRG